MPTTNIVLSQANNSSTAVNELRLNLPQPYRSEKDEIALSNLFIYYSWYNVTAAYGNNTCSYVWTDGVTHNITFPDGFYTVENLSEFIQLQMFNNGHYLLDDNGDPVYYISLTANTVYYRVTLTCSAIPLTTLPTGYTNPESITLNGKVPQLVIANSAFGELIGFSNASYPPTLSTTPLNQNGSAIPQISKVSAVNVCCNMVNQTAFNTYSDVIYTFSPNVTFGSQIQIQPTNPIYFPITEGVYNNLTISFYDQDRNALQIVDPAIVATVMIRAR